MIGEVFTFMSEKVCFSYDWHIFNNSFYFNLKRRIERIIFILLSILLIFTLINSEDRTQRRYAQTVNELTEREFPYILAAPVHEAHYKSAYLMFRDNPILGIGSNLFRHM